MDLQQRISSLEVALCAIANDFSPTVCASSFGAEDMVLTDAIAKLGLGIEIFTLDTGRLPEETYALMRVAEQRYRVKFNVFAPEAGAVERYVRMYGINGFYDGIAQRKECCRIRKVEPLQRALQGKHAWITGLRRAQAASRKDLLPAAFDAENGLQKFNPLLEWSTHDVWEYIRLRDVPYNALHDRGYPSIGCAPCTRAVQPGEDIRAGRWWWEQPEQKECGLHLQPAGDASPQPAQAAAEFNFARIDGQS